MSPNRFIYRIESGLPKSRVADPGPPRAS
jgi:hypothetical protein